MSTPAGPPGDRAPAVAFVAVAGASLLLAALKLSSLGPVLERLLPYSDLWLWLSIAIVAAVFLGPVRMGHRLVPAFGGAALLAFVLAVVWKLATAKAFGFYYDEAMVGTARRQVYLAPRTWLLTGACLAALTLAVSLAQRSRTRWLRILLHVGAVGFGLAAAQYNLLVDESAYADNEINLGVVLMPIVNVFHGALPPLDVQSQYGYYAYLVAPVLKLIGLNLFTMSLVFALLFFACVLAIYVLGTWATGSAVLGSAALLAGFFLNTSFGNLWPAELYYQYRPIRMLAPCVALFLFMWHASRPSAARRLLAVACLAVLVIWNSDSGIPTLAAFVLAVAFDAFFRRDAGLPARMVAFLRECAEAVLVFLGVLGLFATALFLARGQWVTPALFFEPLRIWRMDNPGDAAMPQFFVGWSNPILLPGLVYGVAVTLGLARGAAGTWHRVEQSLVLVGLTGLGIATYGAWRAGGTTNPQAAAIASFLMPLALVQLSFALTRRHPGKASARGLAVPALCLLPVAFLCAAFVLHLKQNFGRDSIPTVAQIKRADPSSEKALWTVPGATPSEVQYVKVKDLARAAPPVPPWLQKARWLQTLPYLNDSRDTKVFIASLHDHYLYAAIHRASPIRIVNYYHIAIFRYWPLLFDKTRTGAFDYVVVDRTFLLRQNDSQGTGHPDTFLRLVDEHYEKVDEKEIGADWNHPGWKPTVVSVYRRRGLGS